MGLPALRNVEAIPITHEGDQLVCLSDPEGIIENQLLLSPLAFLIATYLDGENDVAEIQQGVQALVGEAVPDTEIAKLVGYLDDQGFLLSAPYYTRRNQVVQAFQRSDRRAAYLAGRSYPADPIELREYLNSFLGTETATSAPRGLIVPHIDYDRGAAAYAKGYTRLAGTTPPRTVLLFGVAHMAPPAPITMTHKCFETPLGALPADEDVIARLAAACAWDPFEYEIVHRTEHSIELQAVLLAHLFGEQVRIVPMLCGPFSTSDDDAIDPSVQRFLDVCRETVREADGGMLVLAGADLAHVGRRFGDDFDISDEVVCSVRERDEEALAHAAALDPEAFHASVMRDANARRVCGVNCIYAALRSLGGVAQRAERIYYGYADDPSGGIVSFADIVID